MSFTHGGNIISQARELGLDVHDLIDMSSNLTPLGPVPGLAEVYMAGFKEIGCLPDATSDSLRQAFCQKFKCGMDEVIAGNGTTEFIYDLAAKVACARVVIVNPTYSDYRLGCEYNGKPYHGFSLTPPDFKLSLAALTATLQGGDLVFICNPNNPTGTMTPVQELYEFVTSRPDVHFVIDESYLPFTHESSLVGLPRRDNLFILCSSSKIYGIPGLRLGFMVSSAETLQPFLAKQKPWVVNRPAQLCGEFLLQHGDEYVREVVAFLDRIKPGFVQELSKIDGVEPVAGVTNFILCRLQLPHKVADLQAEMLKQRIMIRDCCSFDSLGDNYFRISLQNEQQNKTFLQALTQCLA